MMKLNPESKLIVVRIFLIMSGYAGFIAVRSIVATKCKGFTNEISIILNQHIAIYSITTIVQ